MNGKYTRSERAQQKRKELARALGRDRLYALAYQDPSLLKDAFAEGFDVEDVATALDVPSQTVYRWVRKHGIETP